MLTDFLNPSKRFNRGFKRYEHLIAQMALGWLAYAKEHRKEAAEARYYGYDLAARMAAWAEDKAKRQCALYKKCKVASTEQEKNDLYWEALDITSEPFICYCEE